MNVNKSHKKAPQRKRALKPIERVPTKKLVDSIKRDIERAIEESESAAKTEKK
jgi:hypothetical protein